MKPIASELEHLAGKYYGQLNSISDEEFSLKPNPAKWSKKEIIGHLIDSAQNNIRRFIVSRYEQQPKIIYNQDEWVRFNNYQQQDSRQLVQLWYLLNLQICSILNNTPDVHLQKTCETETVRSIGWLSTDYVKHLQHHMHRVLNLEEIAYP